ncbi:hypothetical protein MTP99_007866 [Tenebrio molitor]|jgi:hypothetical protein|nr:hypothetical protein MTP99_007866 [Tenebrio molitor]
MPFRCCAPNCRGNYPGGPKVSLFNFPKDKDLKARWVQAIKRQGENGKSFVPTASSKVCELHFHEQDILRFTTMHDEKTGTILKAPLKYPRPAPGIFLVLYKYLV